MFNQLNIQYRLMTLFMVIGLLPAVLGSVFTLQQMTQSVTQNALNDLEGRRDAKQQNIERWFNTRMSNVDMLARSQLAVSTIERLDLSNRDLELSIRNRNQNYFKDFERLYGFDEVLIVGETGEILFSTDPVRQQTGSIHNQSQDLSDVFEQTLFVGSYLTDLIRNVDVANRTYMYIASVVKIENETIGAVIARLPAKTLNLIMTERAGMGQTGDMFLVGSDGLSRSELVGLNTTAKNQSDILNTAINSRSIKQAFAGIKAVGEEQDYRGVPVLSSYSKLDIPFLNWALVLKVDRDEVLQPVFNIQNIMSFYFLLLVALVAAFAWYFASGISRPLSRMTEVSNNLANGQLNEAIIIEGTDEIALLGGSLLNIQDSQRNIAALARSISIGEPAKKLVHRSDDDALVDSLNQMVDILMEVTEQTKVIASGDYSQTIEVRSEVDSLGLSLNLMTKTLQDIERENQQQTWLQESLAETSRLVLDEKDITTLANNILGELAKRLDMVVGAFYINQSPTAIELNLQASFAFSDRKHGNQHYSAGEGLVGQTALEMKPLYISHIPQDYITVSSGLGMTPPSYLNLLPLVYERTVIGVIEVGTLQSLSPIQRQYFETISLPIATTFEVLRSRLAIDKQQQVLESTNLELVKQTEVLQQAEQELLAQQEKLKVTNQNLEDQARELEASETELKLQQNQLADTNRELELKNDTLEQQSEVIESARQEVIKKAEDLTLANRYKSEFLANMSHELRTPLNSLLLLANSFNLNEQGNLSIEQINEAKIIYDSGNDLLNLINEILDLAKIESGRIELHYEEVEIQTLLLSVEGQFQHMASSQGLGFTVSTVAPIVSSFVTDPQRLGQIIKNLVGNALKFTEKGDISVEVSQVMSNQYPQVNIKADELLKFEFSDTGIGIHQDQQLKVFEAFQQLDSGDKRKYGGTGLGLSITRELVNLLGGDISLQSELGKGSVFTVLLPLTQSLSDQADNNSDSVHMQTNIVPPKPFVTPTAVIPDDRDFINDSDSVILIIEDDVKFASVLASEVTKRGYKSLIALTGEEALALASLHLPTGIILDIHLPQMDGWAVLHQLKQNIDTRHIPVHIVSAEEISKRGLKIGAIGHITKPLTDTDIQQVLQGIEHASGRDKKYVLLVEDDPKVRQETAKAIGNDVVSIIAVDNGNTALSVLRDGGLDLMVLDLNLPDMQGIELLTLAASENLSLPPVIVNTAGDLSQKEEAALREYSDSIVVKDVRSHERLVDEVALFLHRIVKQLPSEKRAIIQHLHKSDEPLLGKSVLIAEDDMRTLFVMTKILTENGMNPIKAENGQKALDILASEQTVDIVLMDMMMPVMDGYETMSAIRAMPGFDELPIIALTAKAMKEDRLKCIDAGASDYMTKPVDKDKLLSLMRVWLSRHS